MKVEQAYKDFTDQLKTIYEEREALTIGDMVFENIALISRWQRVTNKQQQLADSVVIELDIALRKLLTHQPIQYVLNEAWFYKMKFFVNSHVLIPRPETEEIVEWIVSDTKINSDAPFGIYDVRCTMYDLKIQNSKFKIQNIIDIGTGSGCIAIALKKELLNTNVFGVDVSADALLVAKKNAADQNVNIELLEMNFLDENTWQKLPVFDIIVSNPPYIPEAERSNLDKNIVDYEPGQALFVTDNDPFIFYKKIALFALKHLLSKGKIYVEIHEKYAEEVMQIFKQYNFSSLLKKDIYGRDRMIRATH